MARRRRTSWRLSASPAALGAIARAVNEDHERWFAHGFDLLTSSSVHALRNGAVTIRLVYRSRTRRQTRTVTFRNSVVPS